MKMNEQTVLVAGGAGGIGSAIARAFAKAGSAVAVCDARLDAAETTALDIQSANGRARAWKMDVTDQAGVERAADEVERQLGAIETWVNAAGISKIVPFLDCTEQTWDQILQVNLKGVFLGCQAAIRRMLPRKRGAIVNLSSQSGKVGNTQYAAYCASKFGVIGLTQSLAVEFAPHGIRVNALCPGIVPTPMWDSQTADYAFKRNMRPEEVRPYLVSRIPLGRVCEPDEVARVAVFLAGEDASYITGQAINLTGGAVMH
jgi:NAD(P)-dependent dehydrogenase (short-subunit alcohol dehydrogenase family)